MSARDALARAQEALVRALAEGAPVPEGFDAERVRAAADALLSKRRRGVRRAWPGVAEALGEDFRPVFDAWARAHPLAEVEPHAGVDGYHFAAALRAGGRLPERGAEDLLRFELRWRLTPDGGVAERRGVSVRWTRLGGRRVLGVRLPGGRSRRWRLPG